MPKKSSTARSGAQRHRPKTQKNIELVRPVTESQEIEEEEQVAKPTASSVPTATTTASATPVAPVAQKEKTETSRGSASERLAARRQATQKTQQRNAAALVTPEHFSYVRRDLIMIAVLAAIMFGVIIVLYFFLGTGA